MPSLPEGVSEDDIYTLRRLVAEAFQNAQKSVASHRKLVVSLKSVQDKASNAGIEEFFNRIFVKMVNRVLGIKKNEGCAERIVKFCESFVTHISSSQEGQQEADDDSVATRFVEYFIRHLLRGIEAKDKVVRFRVCQLIAVTVNHLGEITDDLFDAIKYNLCKRLYDKESTVRLQSVLALSRLQGVDEDEEEDDGITITKLLLSVLQHDSNAEVRRAVLFNLNKTQETLALLLERAWDVHPTNRRAVYSRTMKEIGDFRLLSIGMRERILQWGLQDRDSTVKAAATKMFVTQWLEAADNNLIEVLERLDVLNSAIAEKAMRVFFENRHDTLDKMDFRPEFWQELTAESVFLARTFNQYCIENKFAELAEGRMPELTKLAELIKHYLAELHVNRHSDSAAEIEFIVEQLLIIADTYDFGDEVGRRNTLSLLREVLVNQSLNDVLIQKSVQVLKRISVSESDFSQVLVEVISDIRDTLDETEGEEEQEEDEDTKAKKHAAQLAAMLKCLSIAQSVLELIVKPLDSNVHLTSIVNGLIIPAVKNLEPVIRERGLRCLGLSCLLSKELAIDNLMLFGHCYQKGDPDLQVEAVKIISDILMIHGTSVLDTEGGVDTMSIYKLYYRAARNPQDPIVQATAAEALCKLVLAGIFTDDDLIKALVIIFFDGNNAENAALKQILSFCIPVYCYSSPENQARMARIAVDSLRRLTTTFESTDEEMVGPAHIIQQILDWTDPEKLADTTDSPNAAIHLDLCGDMLRRITASDSKDERRALCMALNKLHFPRSTELSQLLELHELTQSVIEVNAATDSVSKNALNRFEAALSKAIAKMESSTAYVTTVNSFNHDGSVNTSNHDDESDNDGEAEEVEDPTSAVLEEDTMETNQSTIRAY
ncbi:condensin complex subunit 3 [Trichomonascus vanleenenianus]|uniref:condensin subunit YCG1 n=1 Tax=Trichomonascus vanleenenianus TaxID=2268995 RepID=UPI003ECA801B